MANIPKSRKHCIPISLELIKISCIPLNIYKNIPYPFMLLAHIPVSLKPLPGPHYLLHFCSKNLIKYSENTQNDQNLVFKTDYHLNASQKYNRTLQGEHSAILSSFTKIPFVIKTGLLSIFEWPLLAVSSYTHMRICIHVGTPLIISKFATSEIELHCF